MGERAMTCGCEYEWDYEHGRWVLVVCCREHRPSVRDWAPQTHKRGLTTEGGG